MGLKGEVQEVGGVNAFGFRLPKVLFVPKPEAEAYLTGAPLP